MSFNNRGNILRIAALMVAGTIGAGIFGLPYVFTVSGWLVAGAYLLAFAVILAWIHGLYSRTLIATNGEHRLLGLVYRFYGPVPEKIATAAILGGLLLVLLIYLILAEHFLSLFLSDSAKLAMAIFWFSASSVAMFATRRFVVAETIGVSVVGMLIMYVFLSGVGRQEMHFDAVNTANFFFPFAPLLFALAGWTTLEPLTEFGRKRGMSARSLAKGIVIGACGTVILYAMFVFGILGSAPAITPDTVRGLAGWPLWRIAPIAILGLSALWTAYVAIMFEIRKSFETDLGWQGFISALIPLFLPPLLFLFGLREFLSIIGLVGGVFLAIQYVFIILVSKKVLQPGTKKRFLLNVLVTVFFLAAIYEIYHFVIR